MNEWEWLGDYVSTVNIDGHVVKVFKKCSQWIGVWEDGSCTPNWGKGIYGWDSYEYTHGNDTYKSRCQQIAAIQAAEEVKKMEKEREEAKKRIRAFEEALREIEKIESWGIYVPQTVKSSINSLIDGTIREFEDSYGRRGWEEE